MMKSKLKIILIILISAIIVSGLSVYATYNYLASDVKYTKEDGTEISVEDALNELYSKKTYKYVGGAQLNTRNGETWTNVSGNISLNENLASEANGVFTFKESGRVIVYTSSKAHNISTNGSGGQLYHNSTAIYSLYANEIFRKDEINVEKGDTIYFQIASKNTYGVGNIWMYFIN